MIASRAYLAQVQGLWGGITELARQYSVSRTYIYQLLDIFTANTEALLLPKAKPASPSREALEARMLAYRFEGRCSIDAISTLMKRDNLSLSSQGAISERLTQLGQALPNTLPNKSETIQPLVFANDEVYAKSHPILITVDPISSAILRIELSDNRTADQWCQHYEGILENGYSPKQLTSDAGVGICSANALTFADTPWQLDTFHAVAHRLGDWDRRLEKRVESAVNYVIEREEKLASARSDAVIENRLTDYFAANQRAKVARQLHAHFSYLYREIIQQLNTFDEVGNLREQAYAESTIKAALDLMNELDCKTLHKDVTSVRKALPHFLTYFDDAKIAVQHCESLTDNQEALTSLYLAWQWNKAVIKSKKTERKHNAIEQRDFYLEWAMLCVGDKEKGEKLKESVYDQLDHIIQASSMVECINSLLRPYLNSAKNQVTQAFLNLFMFYHNHRRYRAGKRKGKTPLEILTGKEQEEDWVTLLQNELKAIEPPIAA